MLPPNSSARKQEIDKQQRLANWFHEEMDTMEALFREHIRMMK
jgi:hypothetical protein